MEQATLRIKTQSPVTNHLNAVREQDINFWPSENMAGMEIGISRKGHVFVSPEIFTRLVDPLTFEETISGLFVKNV